MKKISLIMLVVCILFSCCSCGNESTGDNLSTDVLTSDSESVFDNSITTNNYSDYSNNITENEKNNTVIKSSSYDNNSTSAKRDNNTSISSSTSKNDLTSAGNIPTHTHNYSKATCTEPATCYCGATSGSKLGHSYNGKSCSRCGVKNPNYVKTYSLGETKNHTWNGGTVTKQASCKENGAAIEKTEKNNTAVYIIIAVCAVVLIGGIAAVVIVKKKKAL